MDTEPMNTEPMNFMKEESQSKNYKYDLVSTIAGATISTVFAPIIIETGASAFATGAIGGFAAITNATTSGIDITDVATDVAITIAGAGATFGGAFAVAGTSIITGVNFKSRHAKIGGLAGLAIYGTTLMGGAIGYNQGKEVRLTPFQTETTRGTVVERTDGTKIPYVLDENNSYIPLSQINDTQLEEVERKYKTLESKILDSANEEK